MHGELSALCRGSGGAFSVSLRHPLPVFVFRTGHEVVAAVLQHECTSFDPDDSVRLVFVAYATCCTVASQKQHVPSSAARALTQRQAPDRIHAASCGHLLLDHICTGMPVTGDQAGGARARHVHAYGGASTSLSPLIFCRWFARPHVCLPIVTNSTGATGDQA